jgi:hypothetical protein
MKLFEMMDLKEAIEYSMKGGQALHKHTFNSGHSLFAKYPEIAHLLDQDKTRLVATAHSLGVRVIKVDHEGQRGQHIDLCGKPFERACKISAQPRKKPDGSCLHTNTDPGGFCLDCYRAIVFRHPNNQLTMGDL